MVLQTKNSVIFLILTCLLTIGCNKEKGIVAIPVDAELSPSLHAEGITTLISDSGIVKYNLKAEVWDMFTQIEDPYWYFPEGIYLEQYDSVFNVEFSIEADTAYYFEERELWRLIGEVFIQNNEGETFETEELFWDSKKPKTSIEAIYTDKQVRITQTDRIIISQGLRANSAMTNYRLFEMYTEMYIDDDEMAVNKEEPEQPSDSIHQ